MKRHNSAAKALAGPRFRKRVVPNKKKYSRKGRTPRRDSSRILFSSRYVRWLIETTQPIPETVSFFLGAYSNQMENVMSIDITIHNGNWELEEELHGIGAKTVRDVVLKYGKISIEVSVVKNPEIDAAAMSMETAVLSLDNTHPHHALVTRLAHLFRRLADEGAFLTCSF